MASHPADPTYDGSAATSSRTDASAASASTCRPARTYSSGACSGPQLDREPDRCAQARRRVAAAEGDDPRREGADVERSPADGQRRRTTATATAARPPRGRADLADDRLGQRITPAQDPQDALRARKAAPCGRLGQPASGSRHRRALRGSCSESRSPVTLMAARRTTRRQMSVGPPLGRGSAWVSLVVTRG